MPPKDKEVKDESGEFVLDLSFGETSHQYDKVSLLGSSLPEGTILSLILSFNQFNHLGSFFFWLFL